MTVRMSISALKARTLTAGPMLEEMRRVMQQQAEIWKAHTEPYPPDYPTNSYVRTGKLGREWRINPVTDSNALRMELRNDVTNAGTIGRRYFKVKGANKKTGAKAVRTGESTVYRARANSDIHYAGRVQGTFQYDVHHSHGWRRADYVRDYDLRLRDVISKEFERILASGGK